MMGARLESEIKCRQQVSIKFHTFDLTQVDCPWISCQDLESILAKILKDLAMARMLP